MIGRYYGYLIEPFIMFLFFGTFFILALYFIIKQSITMKKNKNILREKTFSKDVEEKYLNILAKREKHLSTWQRFIFKTIIVIVNILIIVIICFSLKKQIWFYTPFLIISTIIWVKIDNDYDIRFKEKIVTEIIKEYDANLKYYPYYGISKDEYKKCRFQEYFDHFYSEDLIVNEQTGFQFADILLKKEFEDSEGHTHYDTVYFGSLARLPLKDIHCNIYLGSTERSIFGENEFIELEFENDEFNDLYMALTDNELQAYKILTPDVMEQFVELKKNFFADLDIRLLNDCLYMRFLSGDGFESSYKNVKKEKNDIMISLAVLNEVIKTMQKVKEIIESKNID